MDCKASKTAWFANVQDGCQASTTAQPQARLEQFMPRIVICRWAEAAAFDDINFICEGRLNNTSSNHQQLHCLNNAHSSCPPTSCRSLPPGQLRSGMLASCSSFTTPRIRASPVKVGLRLAGDDAIIHQPAVSLLTTSYIDSR